VLTNGLWRPSVIGRTGGYSLSERPRSPCRVGTWSAVAVLALAMLLAGGGGLVPIGARSGTIGATVRSPDQDSGLPTSVAPEASPIPAQTTTTSQCGFYGAPYGPADVVYDDHTGQIFVSDSETNEIYVISETTKAVVRVISFGSACVNPFGLAYDPNLGVVFAAETGGRAIAAISDESDSVVSTFPVAGNPWNMAYDSGRNELFVTELDQGDISVLSLPSGATLDTISEGWTEQPLGVAYVPAQGEVFVTNSLGNFSDTVSVISDTSDLPVASIPVGCGASPGTFGQIPFGVVSDPATGEVYASCETGNGLAAISAANHIQVGTVPMNSSATALALNEATGEIWAASPFTGQVFAVSVLTNSVVAQGPTGGFPFEGIAVDNRTGEVYVSNWKSENVTVFGPNASPIASIELPPPASASFWSLPTAGWVLLVVALGGSGLFAAAVWMRSRGPPQHLDSTAGDDPRSRSPRGDGDGSADQGFPPKLG